MIYNEIPEYITASEMVTIFAVGFDTVDCRVYGYIVQSAEHRKEDEHQ